MSLTIIIGPMFAGKTTRLLEIALEHKKTGEKIYVINSIHDTRTDNYIKTHDNQKIDAIKMADLNIFTLEFIAELKHLNYTSIIIDEIQFFSNIEYHIKLMLQCGFNVYIAGLQADANQKPFGELPNLLCLADKIEHITGKCFICNKNAAHTILRNQNLTKQILPGGSEKYMCVCRKHLSNNVIITNDIINNINL